MAGSENGLRRLWVVLRPPIAALRDPKADTSIWTERAQLPHPATTTFPIIFQDSSFGCAARRFATLIGPEAFPHRAANLLGIDQLGHACQQPMLLSHVGGVEARAGEHQFPGGGRTFVAHAVLGERRTGWDGR
jgi:hypothetical protein